MSALRPEKPATGAASSQEPALLGTTEARDAQREKVVAIVEKHLAEDSHLKFMLSKLEEVPPPAGPLICRFACLTRTVGAKSPHRCLHGPAARGNAARTRAGWLPLSTGTHRRGALRRSHPRRVRVRR